MTLELNKVLNQIDDMGRILAGRAERQRRALPAAQALLHLYAEAHEELRSVAEAADGRRLGCASPWIESLDQSWPAPMLPEHVTIAAVDGSQVFPDSHGAAFFYLVNTGGIVLCQGSGQVPSVDTRPQLFYKEDDVYPGGHPVSHESVGMERTLAELRHLSALVAAEVDQSPQVPCVALTDGPLLLWFQLSRASQEEQDGFLCDYLASLDRIRASGAVAAGLVSRPQSTEVVTLLYLTHLQPEDRGELTGLADTGYRGLTDRALFAGLPPGYRSALFLRGAGANRAFQAKGHGIYFYYLNTGTELARVEIPEWIVAIPEAVNLVHAVLYDQCQLNNGYPYILTRADELAVILGEERAALDELVTKALANQGMPLPQLSGKARQKTVARWRRR